MVKLFRRPLLLFCVAVCLIVSPCRSTAELTQTAIQNLYDSARQSLVVVQYVWDSELGRHEIDLPGVVVDDHGLVMTSSILFDVRIPESQMVDFKVIQPVDGNETREFTAQFEGRDDRSSMAFVRVKDSSGLAPIHFEDYSAKVGAQVYSVGLANRAMGYKPYITRCMVSSISAGERYSANVDGKLANVGSVVFDDQGQVIGFVGATRALPQASEVRGARGGTESGQNQNLPDSFTPSHEFFPFLKNPPTGKDVSIAWLGVFEMAGLKKEEADFYGLKDPAIQLVAIAPGSPAQAAGLQQGQVLVSLNGKPLPRGDTTDQMPMLLHRELLGMSPNDKITFGVMNGKDEPVKNVTVTLGTAPASMATVPRFWLSDYGFGVRDVVLADRYVQHLAPGTAGVMVSLIKPDGPAQLARLQSNQFISNFNGEAIADVADLRAKFNAWHTAHSHDAVVLLVSGNGKDETLRIEPPQ